MNDEHDDDLSLDSVLGAPTKTLLRAGGMLGPYRLEAKLGAGGMGEVYQATDTRLHRAVAIKVLPRDKVADAERKRRFLQEARAASALNHPNIVTLHDIANDDGVDFLVMEYVEGKSLDKLIAPKGLPLAEVAGYTTQIAGALAAAHAAGIIHRDIKPANVMVTKESQVKILDFGLAKLVERTAGAEGETLTQESALTEAGTVMGTVAYMSPEQASARPTDHRTDIFSLGVMLYEMLTGSRPFRGKTHVETMNAIINTSAPHLENAPLRITDIVNKALEKDPKERYQSAADLAVDLRRALREPAAAKPLRSSGARAWIAVAAAAILAVPAAWWLGGRQPFSPINPFANATFTRLTDFEGSELAAEISPDGKFVAFIADRDGPFDLFVSQIGSGRFLNLTQGRQNDVLENTRSTGFSGDGSEVWVRGGPNPNAAPMIRMTPLLGGPLRPFLQAAVVSYSVDGSKVVFHRTEDGDPIFVADASGANPKQIFRNPNPGVHNHYPVWSRDAKWIYFVRGLPPTGEMDIWRIPPEGGQPEQLTHLNSNISFLAVLDGRTLLYVSPAGDGSGPWLYSFDLDSRVPRRVSVGLEEYLSVATSADGRRAVATVANRTASLWSVPISDGPAQEKDVLRVVLPNVRALSPRIGSNGAVFYLSSLGGGDGLWRFKDNDTLEIWKGREGPLFDPPAISPDGKRVAIPLRRQGKIHLNVMNDDGTGVTALAENLDVRGSPTWSPDGRWIAIGGIDAKGPGLFKVPVEGGDPIRLASTFATNPAWSPDGGVIVFGGPATGRFQPLRAAQPDGTAVQLPDTRVRFDGQRFRFLPHGRQLVYMTGQQRRLDFALLDLTTMKSRPLTQLDNPAAIMTFDVTPDGKKIVFDRLRENSDIVLIDFPKSAP